MTIESQRVTKENCLIDMVQLVSYHISIAQIIISLCSGSDYSN